MRLRTAVARALKRGAALCLCVLLGGGSVAAVLTDAYAAAQGNVGDLFRAIEQGGGRLPQGQQPSVPSPSAPLPDGQPAAPSLSPQEWLNQLLGGEDAPRSLPGTEITPEQMQQIFPAPLGGAAPLLDIPRSVPLWQEQPAPLPHNGMTPLPMAPVQGSTHFNSLGGMDYSLPLTPPQQTPPRPTPQTQRPQQHRAGVAGQPVSRHPAPVQPAPAQTAPASGGQRGQTETQGTPQATAPQSPPRQETVQWDDRAVSGAATASAHSDAPPSGATSAGAPRSDATSPAPAGTSLTPALTPPSQGSGVAAHTGVPENAPPPAGTPAWLPQRPTLAVMLGQMLMVGFNGSDPKTLQPILQAVRQGLVGGVIVCQRDSRGVRNVVSPPQLRSLTVLLQQAAREGSGIPLFIAVEQEGGLVQALPPSMGFEGGTAAQKLGMGTPEQTQVAARRMGLELAGLGVNVDLAPVADVNFNPLSAHIGKKFRSFSAHPRQAAAHALAFGQGLAAVGVIPCLKYFPGTGSLFTGFGAANLDGVTDTIPDLSGSWRQEELIPYALALREGWRGMIMPALAYHRSLDSLHPVTLSASVLDGILRRRMGYGGVIISNDLSRLGAQFTAAEAMLAAVQAGVDIAFFPFYTSVDANAPYTLHAALTDLVRQGRVSEQRVRQSWQRIMRLKQDFFVNY